MSFMDGFTGGDSPEAHATMYTVSQHLMDIGDSSTTISWKSVTNIVYQGGETIAVLMVATINMFTWNFNFLDGMEWLRIILISFNMAILIFFIFELIRALKPFGG
jgi:hypothetical protein